MLKPVKTKTLQDAVYEELFKAILSGILAPKDRITLEQIAKQLNVSQMPVREAIRKLEVQNFVKIENNRRITIAELSKTNFDQILEIRLILECHAAEKASVNRSDESIKELEDAHYKYTHSDNLDEHLKANWIFHGIIYREANLPMLSEIISSMWQKVTPYFYICVHDMEEWCRHDPFKFHEGMLQAMQRKAPEEVKGWLKEDIMNAAKRIREIIE